MSKLNFILICLFVGFLTVYSSYDYLLAEEKVSIEESESNTDSTVDSKANTKDEIDDFEREMRESFELENSPEYKAKREAESEARLQQWKKEAKEKQEKELQQERAEKLRLLYYGTITGIILCVICAITGCDVVHLIATWLFKEYKP